MSIRLRRHAWCALVLSLFAASPAFAIRPYTLLEDGYPEAQGQLELENSVEVTWHAKNEQGFKSYGVEHELEYGLTNQLTVRVAGAYTYEESSEFNGLHFDDFTLEGQYYFTNPNTDAIGVSIIGAIAFGEREAFSGEAFLVLQKDFEKWIVAYNLGLVTDVDNLFGGGDKETAGTLINSAGVLYSFSPRVRAGLEIGAESEYEEWRHYGGTTVYAGPVINFVPSDSLWITVGIDVQLTNRRDEPEYRAAVILGYYF